MPCEDIRKNNPYNLRELGMWHDIVCIASGLSGMALMDTIGTQYGAYKKDGAIVLEIPEEPATPTQSAMILLGFGTILENLLHEPGFARRWENRMLPYCVEIVEG